MDINIRIHNTALYCQKVEHFPANPWMVFLHDSLGCSALWRDFPEILSQEIQYNYVLYDRQGYGKSGPFSKESRTLDYLQEEAEILIDLLNNLNIEQAVLLGHSDGGSIALLAAAMYPDRIRGIITEGAHVFVEEITLRGIREAKESYQKTDLKRKLEKYHFLNTEAMFKAWADTWLREEFRHFNIESILGQINCPCLIIQGEHDEFGTEKQVDAIVSQVKGKSVKKMIPGTGHNPHKDAPEKVVTAVKEFLEDFALVGE